MRILVYPHDLAIGGSQINAIDLAAGVAAAGHNVVVYGIPGPLVPYIESKGLRFIPARRLKYRPAPSRILQLASIARSERLDLIHAYEWPPGLDAYFGAAMLGVPVLTTVLGMSVSPYIPASGPLVMGTAGLGDEARTVHRGDVWVIEPPIDVDNDHPGIDGSAFRSIHQVGDEELLVVTVSRLAIDLKLDPLVRAIDAVDMLAAHHRVRLIVVGGGPAHAALSDRAIAVNQRRGREVITLVGPQLDPRAAYAAADVVIGMGSSALRALAIGRALIVQGEEGFSEVFEPASLPVFLRQGFYGLGDNAAGAYRLAKQLDGLLKDADRRRVLGAFGRHVVVERFSLERAVRLLLDIYAQIKIGKSAWNAADAIRCAYRAVALEIHNHDPRQKRARSLQEKLLFAAASHGPWPREAN